MPEQQPIRYRAILGRFWTVANLFSLARMVLVPPIMYLVATDGPMTTILVLIGIVIATDWLDGNVARWSGTVSEWGKVLDPLADKAAAAGITLALHLRDLKTGHEYMPLWFILLVVVRDVLIIAGSIYLTRRTAAVAMSVWWGKVAVTALALTVLAALLKADDDLMRLCLLVSSVLLVMAFIIYLIRFLRLQQQFREEQAAIETG